MSKYDFEITVLATNEKSFGPTEKPPTKNDHMCSQWVSALTFFDLGESLYRAAYNLLKQFAEFSINEARRDLNARSIGNFLIIIKTKPFPFCLFHQEHTISGPNPFTLIAILKLRYKTLLKLGIGFFSNITELTPFPFLHCPLCLLMLFFKQ